MTTKKKMGRPPKTITDEQVALIEDVAYYGGSMNMAAKIVGVDWATIKSRFSDLFHKKRGEGSLEVLRMQWHAAEKGSAAMLIFLGKNRCGQTDAGQHAIDDVDTGEKAPALVAKTIQAVTVDA